MSGLEVFEQHWRTKNWHISEKRFRIGFKADTVLILNLNYFNYIKLKKLLLKNIPLVSAFEESLSYRFRFVSTVDARSDC